MESKLLNSNVFIMYVLYAYVLIHFVRYINQRNDGPVNAHLISCPRISIYCPAKVKGTSYIPLFTHLVKYINQFPGQRLQKFPKNPSLSHFSI